MDMVVWMISRTGVPDRALQEYLSRKGYVVIGVKAGRQAIPREARGPEILVVDIADPHGNEVILEQVARSALPKLFILPLDGDDLDAFVVQYALSSFVVKPSAPEVIERHVRILLIKSLPPALRDASQKGAVVSQQELRPGKCTPVKEAVDIDETEKTAIVGGRIVDLTPKEFALLRLLSSRPGRVFSTEEIIESVWSGSDHASSLDVQQYVHHLRRKMESDPHHPRWIKNVKGFGYKLDRRGVPTAASG